LPANDRAQLRDALAAVMREAGALARHTVSGPFKRWTKGADESPVSDGDIAVNDLLLAKLPPLVPGAAWLSEETAIVTQGDAPATWIVDPIDGTRAYINGRDDWTISVALAENGRPVLASVFAPVADEMFLAVAGHGATLNGKPIAVSSGHSLTGARLAGPLRYLKRLGEIDAGIAAQPKVHSLALRLTRVAQGELDAAFASPGSHDWDLAAADLLVHEAGGVLTDFNGQPLRYNRPDVAHGALIAAGVARHGMLVELVRDRQSEFA
jgi:myo-inositol-1(or 4)-monophosphatase